MESFLDTPQGSALGSERALNVNTVAGPYAPLEKYITKSGTSFTCLSKASLLVTSYSSPVTRHQLLVTSYSLPATRYSCAAASYVKTVADPLHKKTFYCKILIIRLTLRTQTLTLAI